MTSRLLLSGTLAGPAVRRKRKADGAIFAIFTIKDSDRGQVRNWTCYANDPAVIELLEELRIGEPLAIAGPFTVGGEREIVYRITAESLVDTKRRKKPRGLIGKEQRIEGSELELAPFDDDIPFGDLSR